MYFPFVLNIGFSFVCKNAHTISQFPLTIFVFHFAGPLTRTKAHMLTCP